MEQFDHRILGPRLDLFHQQEEAPGAVFWHPRGVTLYRLLEDFIRCEMRRAGFQEVRTPQLISRSLWERSGHWQKFGEHMFVFHDGERSFALKPMNCPGHIQVFRQQVRSYRDLPLRFAEFGACHRYEPSGALHGLMRSRAFTQDDAHVFCLREHVEAEVARFSTLLRSVYTRLGFNDCIVGFSTRPRLREGSDEVWNEAEALLEKAAQTAGLTCRHQSGEGAFYGPKLEFLLQDREHREWQCGTIQLDLVLPERLDASYVDSFGARVRPVMIHHAVLGSIERFMAMLLEHHRGQLPFWLAPDQVVVAPVSDGQLHYARTVADSFTAAGLRCVIDHAGETLSRRIVAAREKGVPMFATVGTREAAAETVSLRAAGGQRFVMTIGEAIASLQSLQLSPS